MAYRRKRVRRTRRRNAKLTKRTRGAVRSIVRKEVNKITESKYFYRYGSTNGSSGSLFSTKAAGTPTTWTPGEYILQGTTKDTRSGSHIRYLGFKFLMMIENKSSIAPLGVRILYLKKRNIEYNAVLDLFEDNDIIDPGEDVDDDDLMGGAAGGIHINDLTQLYRKINKTNYTVLYDKVIYADRELTSENRRNPIIFKHYFKSVRDIMYGAEGVTKGSEYELMVFYHYITSETIADTVKPNIGVLEMKEIFVE